MFTFATFLGAEVMLDKPFHGACIATAAIFTRISPYAGGPEELACDCGKTENCWCDCWRQCLRCWFTRGRTFTNRFFSGGILGKDMALVLLGFGALKLFKPPMLVLVLGFSLWDLAKCILN